MHVERQILARVVVHVLYGGLRDRHQAFLLDGFAIGRVQNALEHLLLDGAAELLLEDVRRHFALAEAGQADLLRQPPGGVLFFFLEPIGRHANR